jgi:hypothetical protein
MPVGRPRAPSVGVFLYPLSHGQTWGLAAALVVVCVLGVALAAAFWR